MDTEARKMELGSCYRYLLAAAQTIWVQDRVRSDEGLDPPKIKVLYIAGYPRSGSTMMQRVLGSLDGWFAAGEIRSLWSTGLDQNRLCGCNERLGDCEVWQPIFRTAFGKIEPELSDRMAQLSGLARSRFLPLLLLPFGRLLLRYKLKEYLHRHSKLYGAVEKQTNCRVIIDSSKSPLYGLLLRFVPNIEVYVLHLIRDPRGAEYSHYKLKKGGDDRLKRHSAVLGAMKWIATNLSVETFLGGNASRYLSIPYEDFINQPESSVRRIVDFIGDNADPNPFSADHQTRVGVTHTIGGSLHKFDGETITLQIDDEWKERLPVSQRRTISLFAAPLLARYGYLRSPGRLGAMWRFATIGLLLANRALGSVLRLLINIVLGRSLGLDALGIYYLFASWTRSLGIVSGLGLPQYTLRSLSIMEDEKRRLTARRFIVAALKLASVAGILIAALIWLLSNNLALLLLGEVSLAFVLRAASLAAVTFILLRLVARAYASRRQSNAAVFAENNVVPLGLLLLIGSALVLDLSLDIEGFLWGYLLVSTLSVAWVVAALLRRNQTEASTSTDQPPLVFNKKSMSRFWMLGIVTMASNNLFFLLLPQFAVPMQIGLFGIAHRFVVVAVIILDSLSSFFAPRFAQAFDRGDQSALRHLLRESQWYSLGAYLLFTFAIFFFGRPLLGVIGPEFRDAWPLLLIMIIGQIIRSGAGLSGMMLQMANRERELLYISLFSVAVASVGIVVLGNIFGVKGIALAHTIVVSLRSLLVYMLARSSIRELEISTGDRRGI